MLMGAGFQRGCDPLITIEMANQSKMKPLHLEDRLDYYNRFFEAHNDEQWDQAPGKDVFIQALKGCLADGILNDHEKVLDMGCGTGFLLDRIHHEVHASWELVGIDFSEKAIKRGKSLYPLIELHRGDATETDFPSDQFSLIISYGTIEHFIEPAHGIRELFRLLAQGGRFLVMVPTLGVYRTDRDDEGWYEDLTGQLQWNFFRTTWGEHFSGAGLSLYPEGVSGKYGALKPGVFYFGHK